MDTSLPARDAYDDDVVAAWDIVLQDSSTIYESSNDQDGLLNCVPLLPSLETDDKNCGGIVQIDTDMH